MIVMQYFEHVSFVSMGFNKSNLYFKIVFFGFRLKLLV